jgi:hypothetical protein
MIGTRSLVIPTHHQGTRAVTSLRTARQPPPHLNPCARFPSPHWHQRRFETTMPSTTSIDGPIAPPYARRHDMSPSSSDAIAAWFAAAEELGEYIGIRFGHTSEDAREPSWSFLRHVDFDGIGGFAELLRQEGAQLPRLPQIRHPRAASWSCLLRALPKYASPRRRVRLALADAPTAPSTRNDPPRAVAWHLFDESTTTRIRLACRNASVTVNSFLLKHLTKAIRPFIEVQSTDIPWMIPVNLRGKVDRGRDTANHTSYVGVRVRSYETVRDIHRNVYAALASGEHWANWYAYQSGNLFTAGMRRQLIVSERCMSQWNLGSFSNLGDWDPEKRITKSSGRRGWFFCPPVLRCQPVGAGCVTFQNRLSLTIQAHPELTVQPQIPNEWLQGWIREIEIDLASIFGGTSRYPKRAA